MAKIVSLVLIHWDPFGVEIKMGGIKAIAVVI
jgi:hypothetical protein